MSKIELSKWQDIEDGFPSDSYRDAVMVALENAGIKVHDYWRDERWDFNFELDRAAFDAGGFPPGTQDLIIGWRVGEESEPLEAKPGDSWRGFEAVGQITAWHYVPCKDDGVGHYVRELCHPDHPNSPINPLAEPSEVAAAVAALVRGSSPQDHQTTKEN